MKKKLLYVVNNAKFFMSHRITLAQAAQHAGYEVHVATPTSEHDQQIINAGFIHHTIKLDRGGMNPFKDIITLFSWRRLYRRLKPDIVHHITSKPILYGSIAARLANVPAVINTISGLGFIFISQSTMIRIIRTFVKRGYKIAFNQKNIKVIFQNEADRQEFIYANILSLEKTILIPGSGVCTKTFYPTAEEENTLRVILAARLLWDKGIGEFVQAARIIKKKIATPIEFIIVGSFDEANPASISEKQLQEWQKEGVIQWWGERTDMPQILQKAHIICLPSYREGLPRILLEAAASARAIVTTDVPGCRDIVRDSENGLLVPAKDSEKLAMAIETLIQNPQLRKKMAAHGRELVENKYALNCIIEQTLSVYKMF